MIGDKNMEDYRDCQLPISLDTDVQLRREDAFTTIGKIPDKIVLYNKHNNDYLSTVSKQSANNLRTYGQFCKMLSDGLINADTNSHFVSNAIMECLMPCGK
jgi:hypothetical protein